MSSLGDDDDDDDECVIINQVSSKKNITNQDQNQKQKQCNKRNKKEDQQDALLEYWKALSESQKQKHQDYAFAEQMEQNQLDEQKQHLQSTMNPTQNMASDHAFAIQTQYDLDQEQHPTYPTQYMASDHELAKKMQHDLDQEKYPTSTMKPTQHVNHRNDVAFSSSIRSNQQDDHLNSEDSMMLLINQQKSRYESTDHQLRGSTMTPISLHSNNLDYLTPQRQRRPTATHGDARVVTAHKTVRKLSISKEEETHICTLCEPVITAKMLEIDTAWFEKKNQHTQSLRNCYKRSIIIFIIKYWLDLKQDNTEIANYLRIENPDAMKNLKRLCPFDEATNNKKEHVSPAKAFANRFSSKSGWGCKIIQHLIDYMKKTPEITIILNNN